MLGLFARLLRVFWRQDTEGSQNDAVILRFPTVTVAAANQPPADNQPTAAIIPVAFIRRAAEPIARRNKVENRQLAARLLAVERLNPPSSRARGTKPSGHAQPKAKVVTAYGAIKKNASSHPGIVLNRIGASSARSSAEIVSLTDVRRARQIVAADCEIAALFN
jgi:hypothetical protein